VVLGKFERFARDDNLAPAAAASTAWHSGLLMEYGPDGIGSCSDDKSMRAQMSRSANIRSLVDSVGIGGRSAKSHDSASTAEAFTADPRIAEVRKEPRHRRDLGETWSTDRGDDRIAAPGCVLLVRDVPEVGGESDPGKPACRQAKRRLGIFFRQDVVFRSVGAILLEQQDKWIFQRSRRMTRETIATLRDGAIVGFPVVAA